MIKPYVLLVEGPNDKHVIWALCQHYQVPQTFDVVDCNGIDNLFGQLNVRLKNPDLYKRIGIVVDADEDIHSRWEKFKHAIKDFQQLQTADLKMQDSGLVVQIPDGMRIGAWMMPDNRLNGMLEDFVLSLAEDGDALMAHTEGVINDLEKAGLQRYHAIHRSKAKIHTFLAWQKEPGKPMGQAITAHILNPDSPNAQTFVEWLKRLFLE